MANLGPLFASNRLQTREATHRRFDRLGPVVELLHNGSVLGTIRSRSVWCRLQGLECSGPDWRWQIAGKSGDEPTQAAALEKAEAAWSGCYTEQRRDA